MFLKSKDVVPASCTAQNVHSETAKNKYLESRYNNYERKILLINFLFLSITWIVVSEVQQLCKLVARQQVNFGRLYM